MLHSPSVQHAHLLPPSVRIFNGRPAPPSAAPIFLLPQARPSANVAHSACARSPVQLQTGAHDYSLSPFPPVGAVSFCHHISARISAHLVRLAQAFQATARQRSSRAGRFRIGSGCAFGANVVERFSEVVLPGASLIISDEGASIETGKDTDFVVLMSGEPQGGIKTRHPEGARYRQDDDD